MSMLMADSRRPTNEFSSRCRVRVFVDRTGRRALESEMRVGGWVSAVGFGRRFILSGDVLYLMVMMVIIALICAAIVPSLFFKKCAKCGRRNGIEAPVCKQCGTPFPETK